MTKMEFSFISEIIDKIKEKPICGEDLKPFLKSRTLLYGYTCEKETFHVYLKDKEIHVVIYENDYSQEKVKPKNMREVEIKTNQDYIPNKRLYPEACDYNFCKLLKHRNINLPFTTFNDERPKSDFYGFTLDDKGIQLSKVNIEEYRNEMTCNVLCGGNINTIFTDLSGNPILSFYGHTYEPYYEDFIPTCKICGYDETGKEITLFDEEGYSDRPYHKNTKVIGSMEEVLKYINQHNVLVIKK